MKFVNPTLLETIETLNAKGLKKVVTTMSRASTVTNDMVGHTIGVHNGKIHSKVNVVEEMVGHKLGEFSPTRTRWKTQDQRKGKKGGRK